MNTQAAHGGTLRWDIAVPLWSNPLIVGATFKVFALASAVVAGMVSLVLALQGEWDAIVPICLGFGAAGLGLFVLGLLVMALFLGNRMHCRFTVDDDGIVYETIDTRIRAANRWVIVLGVLLGRPQAIGAGLIGQSQEMQSLHWRGAFRAEYLPKQQVIVLRNRWRRLMLVYASADNYAVVAARIAEEMAHFRTAARVPARSPLPGYLWRSALVVVACLPLFGLVRAFDVSLLLPLLQLCFGLATVWLIGLFGYVLIGVDLLILGALLMHALTQRESWVQRGDYYSAWTVYSGDDWALLALATLALVVLATMGWRAAHGRPPAMLMADFVDAGV